MLRSGLKEGVDGIKLSRNRELKADARQKILLFSCLLSTVYVLWGACMLCVHIYFTLFICEGQSDFSHLGAKTAAIGGAC